MFPRIKSKLILSYIFDNLRKRIKLKIVKYNKLLTEKLNVKTKDYMQYYNLKEFNQIFKLNIEDIDIAELNLNSKKIGNEGLNFLFKINFTSLKQLNLYDNILSYVKVLEKINLKNLEKLSLRCNYLNNINALININFRDLKELDLSFNKIDDINELEFVKINHLEKLNLSYNKISNINVLEKVNFKDLKFFLLIYIFKF